MAHITFIHGMANKPAADRLHRRWCDAIARDNPKPEVFPGPNDGLDIETYNISSEMVYWADVLYSNPDSDESDYGYEKAAEDLAEGVPNTASDARRVVVPDLSGAGYNEEERRVMGRLAAQLGVDQDFADDYEASSEEQGKLLRDNAYRLERFPLPWIVKKQIMKVLLRDVHHYLFNTESNPRGDKAYKVRDDLRARLIAALKRGAGTSGPHVLVSHSMGTIISYDVLRNCPECPPIDGLVTLGSPLGLDEVQDKLKPPGESHVDFPSQTLRGRWVNVFDRLDPVAGFNPYFANDYQKNGRRVVNDIKEQNWGEWRHSIQKYLSGPRFRAELRGMLGL
jgi:pimeloyl-ACP methyl ester carboxylesterase